MGEERQPQKLRLLTRGKQKVDVLFRRRKKVKQTDQDDHYVEEDDFEDEVPILSRIADPAATKPSNLRLKINQQISTSEGATEEAAQDYEDEGMQVDGDIGDNMQAIRAKRRRGITGIDELKDSQHFQTQTIVAHHRAIAKQPSSTSQPLQFDFNDSEQAITISATNFGPKAVPAQPTES